MIPPDWPNRTSSRLITAGGLRWHVQVAGSGPVLLLVHGTGAATHSWRDLLPLLARHFTVVAPDLPGHGFTQRPRAEGLSLPGMARGVTALLRALGLRPDLAAGHSAGAAVIARMTLDGGMAPRALVGLNAALLPFEGLAGQIFSPIARLLSGVPAVPWFFAWRAGDRGLVERLLRDTGSSLDARGVELYGRLVRQPGHVAAALGMMAHWELRPLLRDLKTLTVPLVLVVGGHDRTVPPSDARRIRAAVPGTRIIDLPALGHLAHEERPAELAGILLRVAEEAGLLAPVTA